MVQFNCPSCGASYVAPPSDSGSVVECNACRVQFEVPFGPPSPPKRKAPKPEANEAVEVHPCPKCDARLSVLASDLGTDIECPSCQTVFPAARADGPPPAPPKKSAAGKRKKLDRDDDDDDDDDDEDRPKKRKAKKRKGSSGLRDDRYRSFSPHDGVLMLILSGVAFALNGGGLCCIAGAFAGMVLSGFVIFKASMSVREVKAGTMEPGGRVLLEVARGLAALNILLAIANVAFAFIVQQSRPVDGG